MILSNEEINEMSVNELKEKIMELRKELMKSRGKSASKVMPENPGRVKEIKRTIARMLTSIKKRGKTINQ